MVCLSTIRHTDRSANTVFGVKLEGQDDSSNRKPAVHVPSVYSSGVSSLFSTYGLCL